MKAEWERAEGGKPIEEEKQRLRIGKSVRLTKSQLTLRKIECHLRRREKGRRNDEDEDGKVTRLCQFEILITHCSYSESAEEEAEEEGSAHRTLDDGHCVARQRS